MPTGKARSKAKDKGGTAKARRPAAAPRPSRGKSAGKRAATPAAGREEKRPAPPRRRVPTTTPKGTGSGQRTGRSPAAIELFEKLSVLQQEKGQLQDLLRQMRAELDSALAEKARLEERITSLESENSRTAGTEDRSAGPGSFDPSVDLEDELPAMADDDLEGAAGFFDRMDEIRARRNELDRERNDRELEQSEQSFWMICPKCGDLMEEQESENVKIERCETCGGLYMDRGEVDLLLALATGSEGFRRLHNMLKF